MHTHSDLSSLVLLALLRLNGPSESSGREPSFERP
jgi:hypothetical protein